MTRTIPKLRKTEVGFKSKRLQVEGGTMHVSSRTFFADI